MNGLAATMPLLDVRNLRMYFPVRDHSKRRVGWLKALDDVSFVMREGEIFGIVGESGCGKSTLGKAIMGIHRPSAGSVLIEGNDIANLRPDKTLGLRNRLQYTYQDPGASLDPR